MKVILAGFNLDREIIKSLEKNWKEEKPLTPETLPAAYARISRDPRPIPQLREIAYQDIEKSRELNKRVIFRKGHRSVAEHAVFNFDLLEISRLALEILESHRFCSFTEKSQRYLAFEQEYFVPTELKDKEKEEFITLIEKQYAFYTQILSKLSSMHKKKSSNKRLNKKAKEEARYILSLATSSQVGFTTNARSLEYILQRFRYHSLAEIRELGSRIYQEVKNIAPSLFVLGEESETSPPGLERTFLKYGEEDLKEATSAFLSNKKFLKKQKGNQSYQEKEGVTLIEAEGIDEKIISSLIAKNSELSLEEARIVYRQSAPEELKTYLKNCLKHLSKEEALPREFEVGSFIFELTLSASCFAQLKRHRLVTLLAKDYDPSLGLVVPSSLKEIQVEKTFQEIGDLSSQYYCYFRKKYSNNPLLANYCLTNAHQRKIILSLNLRELYHLSRLREDKQAQEEIRKKVGAMVTLAKKAAPLTTFLLGGKDQFEKIKEEVYLSTKY